MRLPAALLLSLVLLSSLANASDPLDAPGPEIVRNKTDTEWQPLFSALGQRGGVRAAFTERRFIAVRKEPTEIRGQLRLAPDRGLSLDYGERTMIVDARGVLVRDKRGRTRVVRPDDRATAPGTLLLPLLTFDLGELEKTFVIRGARAGDRWRLDFTPRATESGEKTQTGVMVVRGHNTTIDQIELRPKSDLRIEIVLADAHTDVTFSAEELRRCFR